MAAILIPVQGGSQVILDKPIILIGRHQECDVSLPASSKVSRRHCCIVQVGERYVLRDLGSMNGIRVNGHRIVETELCPGDEVAVADICFTFHRENALPSVKPLVIVKKAVEPTPAEGSEFTRPGADTKDPRQTHSPDSSGIEAPGDVRRSHDSQSPAGVVSV
jgi:pSer/pThr/pTyr-binding forkhead associated (FHA) protein